MNPSTAWEKLLWMQQHAHTVHVDVNEHRTYYETAAQNFETRDADVFDADDDDVKAECVRRNEMVSVQVYPITPIGFFRIVHYDLGKAIEIAYDCVVKDLAGAGPRPTSDPPKDDPT
jgi:hypothetical protein